MLKIMSSLAPPNISSFVIRFVIDRSDDAHPDSATYRGSIRHIQSDEEMNFSAWNEAVAFIHRFVPLEDDHPA
jgi:hypothetical protein